MSNRHYYDARAAGICPLCAVPSAPFVYCATHREVKRVIRVADQRANRDAYNQYMRVWKSQRLAHGEEIPMSANPQPASGEEPKS